MKILWIATKEPWPPADGGRLVLLETMKSLAALGHSIALVAPSALPEAGRTEVARQLAPWCRATLVTSSPRGAWRDAAALLPGGDAWTLRRHRRPEVRAAALDLIRCESFDVVIAEQLQALSQAPLEGGAPVVLRAQNVESDLWRGAAALGGWRAPVLRSEAERLARAEAAAVRAVACAVALSRRDAERLRDLGGEQSRVETIAAPFPAALDAGPPLPGEPALVLFGSAGWAPNRDQARWFVRSVWPAVRAALPAARLHGFGGEALDAAGVEWHAAPQDSRSAFADGAIFVVPLRLGSGVRMKILEAWARCVPVVATPEGAAGLAARAGEDLIVAADANLAGEIVRLAGDPALRARLVASARETLMREHAPAVVGRAWQTLLGGVAGAVKILLVTTRYPWPPRRGLELRSLQFAQWLSREHDVTLLAPRPPGPAPARPTTGYRCELYPTRRIFAALGVVRALAGGWPLQAGLYEQPGLSAALRRLLPETDFVLAQLARLASHLRALRRKPLLVDFVDSLGMSFARRALVDQPSRRWLWRLEARWLDHHERLLAENAAASWIVSERDRAHLASGLSPAAASRLRVLPPAVALAPAGPRLEEPALLVVTGNLGYHPTVEGLVWWLREVWPTLRARRPEMRLLLAGSRPSKAVQSAAQQAGVELRVDPPDLGQVLARATLALAPARSGAGVPMKVLEAWAAGVPVVAHPWSAFGAGGVANVHLLVAETREEWVEACSQLLESPAERERLRQAAWARLRQAFAPEVLAGQLLEQVREVTAGREPLTRRAT